MNHFTYFGLKSTASLKSATWGIYEYDSKSNHTVDTSWIFAAVRTAAVTPSVSKAKHLSPQQ